MSIHHAALLVLLSACSFSPSPSATAVDASVDAPPSGPIAPSVVSHTPLDGSMAVPLDQLVSVTFSEPMDPATLTASTFTLTAGTPAVPVQGLVTYAGTTAVFVPTADLASAGAFVATITTAATSDSGLALGSSQAWTFSGVIDPHQVPVQLRSAGHFAILAKAGISGITATVTGDLGVSPAAATLITGFSLALDAGGTFSTSTQVTGRVYAADYGIPTPAMMTLAIGDLQLAITDAAARTPDVSELAGGALGGLTLAPGTYAWSSGVTIQTDLTLVGSAADVWIFQIAQDVAISAQAHVVLTGGALAKNVFWQVQGGPTTLAAGAHLEGIVLTQTAVTFAAGASVHGRLLAQTSVNANAGTVVEPAP